MVILTPIEREPLRVFLKEKPAHMVALVCRYETVVANMVFSKRELSFCVLEYSRTSSVMTILAASQGNYVCGRFLKKNLESFSLYRRKNYHDPLRSLSVANF
jgi:hypothetical protein